MSVPKKCNFLATPMVGISKCTPTKLRKKLTLKFENKQLRKWINGKMNKIEKIEKMNKIEKVDKWSKKSKLPEKFHLLPKKQL